MTKTQMSHLRECAQRLQGKPVLLLSAAVATDASRPRGAASMLASLRGASDISLLSELIDQQQSGTQQMLVHQVRPLRPFQGLRRIESGECTCEGVGLGARTEIRHW